MLNRGGIFVFFMFRPNTILIAAAVIPAVFLLVMVYKMDHLDREPMRLLLGLVVMGIVSAGLSMITERAGMWILEKIFRYPTRLYFLLSYFVVVACSEEGFKYLLMKRRTWNSEAFNCQFDGIVYAVFVSLGFALWENIGYVLMYGFTTALLRAVTAIPGHACFGVFMGAWYGVAKKYDNIGYPARSSFFRKLAVLVPVLLHGAYDYIAAVEMQNNALYFIVFILIIFACAFFMVRKVSTKDHYI